IKAYSFAGDMARVAIVEFFGEHVSPKGLKFMKKVLLTDKYLRVRAYTAQILESLVAAEKVSPAVMEANFGKGYENAFTGFSFLVVNKKDMLLNLGQNAVPALIGALHDKDASLREFAAQQIGIIDVKAPGEYTEEAVGYLIEALSDKKKKVVAAAAVALGMINDYAAIKPLTIALEEAPDANTREAIIKTLTQLTASLKKSRGQEVVGVLGRLWQLAKDILYKIGTLLEKVPGIKIAGETKMPQWKRAPIELYQQAAGVLNRTGRALKLDPEKVAVDVLIDTLSDEDENVRESTRTSLFELAAPTYRVIKGNTRAMLSSSSAKARKDATKQLANTVSSTSLSPELHEVIIQAYIRGMKTEADEETWVEMARALTRTSTEEQVASSYIRALDNPNQAIRIMCIENLEALEVREAESQLRSLLEKESADSEVHKRAAQARETLFPQTDLAEEEVYASVGRDRGFLRFAGLLIAATVAGMFMSSPASGSELGVIDKIDNIKEILPTGFSIGPIHIVLAGAGLLTLLYYLKVKLKKIIKLGMVVGFGALAFWAYNNASTLAQFTDVNMVMLFAAISAVMMLSYMTGIPFIDGGVMVADRKTSGEDQAPGAGPGEHGGRPEDVDRLVDEIAQWYAGKPSPESEPVPGEEPAAELPERISLLEQMKQDYGNENAQALLNNLGIKDPEKDIVRIEEGARVVTYDPSISFDETRLGCIETSGQICDIPIDMADEVEARLREKVIGNIAAVLGVDAERKADLERMNIAELMAESESIRQELKDELRGIAQKFKDKELEAAEKMMHEIADRFNIELDLEGMDITEAQNKFFYMRSEILSKAGSMLIFASVERYYRIYIKEGTFEGSDKGGKKGLEQKLDRFDDFARVHMKIMSEIEGDKVISGQTLEDTYALVDAFLAIFPEKGEEVQVYMERFRQVLPRGDELQNFINGIHIYLIGNLFSFIQAKEGENVARFEDARIWKVDIRRRRHLRADVESELKMKTKYANREIAVQEYETGSISIIGSKDLLEEVQSQNQP
ncbi:MAG: HEAT repeat domain-containing protein, partial [Candidatus Omnitrophota bacterium]